MTLVYCVAAAQAELARAKIGDEWRVLHKPSLGLVPVVNGKCPFCDKPVRTVI